MKSRTQRISIMGIIGGIATFSGILVDIPQLIGDNIASVPSFLKTPNAIWAMSIFSVYGLWILFFLLKDRKTGSWSAIAADRIGAVLINLADFLRKHDIDWDLISLGTHDRTTEQREAILRYCTKELPETIRISLGEKERDLYLKHTEWVPLVRQPANEEGIPNVYMLGIWNWLSEYVNREAMEALRRDAATIQPS